MSQSVCQPAEIGVIINQLFRFVSCDRVATLFCLPPCMFDFKFHTPHAAFLSRCLPTSHLPSTVIGELVEYRIVATYDTKERSLVIIPELNNHGTILIIQMTRHKTVFLENLQISFRLENAKILLGQ